MDSDFDIGDQVENLVKTEEIVLKETGWSWYL